MGVTKFTLITDDGEEIVMEGDNLTTSSDLSDFDDDHGYATCPECDGTGDNKWDDGITPCDYCNGEGYLWWE